MPRWSPDGRSIAFDSQAEDGRFDVWTIGVDGSGLRQVTHDPADENTPSWSRDGRFLYFESNRTGRLEIWRVARAGGAEEQVTHEGGCNAALREPRRPDPLLHAAGATLRCSPGRRRVGRSG